MLSNSGPQGPARGLRTKLPRRIDWIRGSLNVHQHSETSIKPLEDIPTAGELEFRGTPGDRKILNLGHKLITVLDPNSSADGPSIISQSYLELNFLTRDSRIGKYLQFFNIQGPNPPIAHNLLITQCPSRISSFRAKLPRHIDPTPGALDIRLHGEAMVRTGKSIRTFGKIDLIIPRPESGIPYLADDLVLVLNGEGDSSGITRAVCNRYSENHPLSFPNRVRRDLQLKNSQVFWANPRFPSLKNPIQELIRLSLSQRWNYEQTSDKNNHPPFFHHLFSFFEFF